MAKKAHTVMANSGQGYHELPVPVSRVRLFFPQ